MSLDNSRNIDTYLNKMGEVEVTYYAPLVFFYTPWKHQKQRGFLIFPGGDIVNNKWVK